MEAPSQAPSPFLPGTNIRFAWDSTTLSALKTCPRLYFYQYIEGWSSGEESVHLRFGIELHKALEDFDKALAKGASREEALFSTLCDTVIRTWDWEVDTDTKAGKYKNKLNLWRTVVDYIDHYAYDAAKTVILADGTPAVELSFSFELDWGPRAGENWYGNIERTKEHFHQPYLLCGHLDRVVDFQDALFVMDRKTTTSLPGSYYFDQYDPHNQMTLYTLASKVILDAPIAGVVIDACQILVGSSRFVRGITYRTADRLSEWTDELRLWFAMAEQYAASGYWPQNDTACDKFGGCKFREVCSKSPQVREQFLRSRFTKLEKEDRWNPLKPR